MVVALIFYPSDVSRIVPLQRRARADRCMCPKGRIFVLYGCAARSKDVRRVVSRFKGFGDDLGWRDLDLSWGWSHGGGSKSVG